ncbi:MAG: hypothetical protein G01um101425_148 [Candidatus Peregrinibacteria bacterium Gr01-1014_25]|nr:MAG: hypothetical protein G01um101425_148 [Candidatus Peregrinibacteria bacterium Gr01-1014_25]
MYDTAGQESSLINHIGDLRIDTDAPTLIRELRISTGNFSRDDLALFRECNNLGHIQHLDVSQVGDLTPSTLGDLIALKGSMLPMLQAVRASHRETLRGGEQQGFQGIREQLLAAMARPAPRLSLEQLRIDHNRLNDHALYQTLLRGNLAHIGRLDIRGNPITTRCVDELRERNIAEQILFSSETRA